MKTETRNEGERRWESYDPRAIERAILFRLDGGIDFNSDTGRNQYSVGQLEKTDEGYQIRYFDRVGEEAGMVSIAKPDVERILDDDTSLSARFASYVEQINELSGMVEERVSEVRKEEPSSIEEVVEKIDIGSMDDEPIRLESVQEKVVEEEKEPRYVEPEDFEVIEEGARFLWGGAKAVGRFASKVGRTIYNVGHVWPGTTLFTPSIARKLAVKMSSGREPAYGDAYGFGSFLAGIGATMTTVIPLAIASEPNSWLTYDAQHFKEAAITVGAFNAASLVYEVGRYVKFKAGLRKGSKLEEKVGEVNENG